MYKNKKLKTGKINFFLELIQGSDTQCKNSDISREYWWTVNGH